MEGGQGGRWGGGTTKQWSKKRCTGFFFWKNLTIGLIWLVTRVGGWGEAWGGGPWRAGKGGDGGGHREQCESNKRPLKTAHGGWARGEMGGGGALVPLFGLPYKPNSWSDLAADEGGGIGGGVGRWLEGGQGGDGGGAPESSVGATKVHWFFWAP